MPHNTGIDTGFGEGAQEAACRCPPRPEHDEAAVACRRPILGPFNIDRAVAPSSRTGEV
jgi:hypothetical protein